MKAELVKKTDEFMKMLLEKPVEMLTVEEYMLMDKKLGDIKNAEAEAARRLDMLESERRLRTMMDAVFHKGGEDNAVQ